ncbi:MAG: DUF1365 domain-containing protein [Pseudohongiella sp.]|nr:DUF1365 domain-containing protein [Pseudohongiella sp.]MDP1756016.1 DUF1365 domain-containing protein [Pseudohongiella sp.]
MNSAIYTGIVRHRRLHPVLHHFRYRVFMMYLDLDELETVFDKSWCWSSRNPALAWFRRKDFLNPETPDLKQAVLDCVYASTGERPDGAVCVLSNLRYFGYLINPITCYYVFGNDGALRFVVAEVTNTPWGESTHYVIPCGTVSDGVFSFEKQMHVSPFMPMNMTYRWRSSSPAQRLNLNLQNWQADRQIFNASLSLQKQALTPGNLRRMLMLYPLMTVQVFVAIYWQALKLFVKKVPIVAHPAHVPPAITQPAIPQPAITQRDKPL